MAFGKEERRRLLRLLSQLYPTQTARRTLSQLLSLVERFRAPGGLPPCWEEKDVVLISYGGGLADGGRPGLQVLDDFVAGEGLHELFSTLHILPFFPSSSDDGFSVIDYRSVASDLGDWDDIARIRSRLHLMFDLVLNHCSRRSPWFEQYLEGRLPGLDYFIEADPGADWSQVVRPRSSPLLTPFQTSRGLRRLWTTFSEDQVDLNFAQPAVLLEMLSVLLAYIERGARIIRLDAVAFLWKQAGTSCLNLPQTHAVVQLMRRLVERLAPGVLLITETNLPHQQNISYFGEGDEAHLVYQFSLPPLLLDAFLNQDAGPLIEWTRHLSKPPEGSCYLNFTASHDGIGLRPLEGLVSRRRLDRLVRAAREKGGLVSQGRRPDGSQAPYELNITYRDALFGDGLEEALEVRRFLSSQALMLAFRGIPAVYFHSLVGTPNDLQGYRSSGIKRRINRHIYGLERLRRVLLRAGAQRSIYQGYRRLLEVRRSQSAFHPQGGQELWPASRGPLFGLLRSAPDHSQRLLVIVNCSARPQTLTRGRLGGDYRCDLLSGRCLEEEVRLEPFQALWLAEQG
ncbi:MAG TPA: sugar phosphorylase [Acidobacteriota bacterium]|nr:sugar phosphorylase [Acidobacteriota bacterium]